MRQTYMAKPSTVEKKWYVIDAEGQTLGRLSSEVASILRGKHNLLIHHISILGIMLSLSMLRKLC